MAALPEPYSPRLVDLRQMRSADLNYLLEEETQVWRENLEWDFSASAQLVRRFLDMEALGGFALLLNGRAIGYSYFVCEDRKGLIGDLYVLKQFATPENEGVLLSAVLEALFHTPVVKRVESQLMMLRNGTAVALPHWRHLRVFRRNFMELPLAQVDRLPSREASRSIVYDHWTERKQDEAGAVIANAYQGHIDSQINDQYRSPSGARRFLMNIVQFPGCDSFFPNGSFVALDNETRRLSGMCLSSIVSADAGHITQVCVTKAARGKGIGYELMRRSLTAMAENGCRTASLTVTAANTEAITVYEKLGFVKTREFTALVWDGF